MIIYPYDKRRMPSTELQELIKELRPEEPREFDDSGPIAMWTEKDVSRGRVVDAFVLILRTRGCYWALHSGCTMCGYINDARMEPVSAENLRNQMEKAMERYHGEKVVKIFTSGSFLDPNEIPFDVQAEILRSFEGAERLIVESLPEFVIEKRLRELYQENLEIAIGLESADDEVLEKNINKSFRVKDYIKASEVLKKLKIPLKTYVLLKPPFLTEKEAIEDAVNSILFASRYSSEISLNPINIQNFTLVHHLWRRREYRAPWLWSVVEVLKRAKPRIGDVRLVSWPTAGGMERGAHNCGRCDKRVMGSIEEFSLSQNLNALEGLYCMCIEKWRDTLELSGLNRFVFR